MPFFHHAKSSSAKTKLVRSGARVTANKTLSVVIRTASSNICNCFSIRNHFNIWKSFYSATKFIFYISKTEKTYETLDSRLSSERQISGEKLLRNDQFCRRNWISFCDKIHDIAFYIPKNARPRTSESEQRCNPTQDSKKTRKIKKKTRKLNL